MHTETGAPDAMPAKKHPDKKRLDLLLVERGLLESREKAQAMILAGKIRAAGQRASKAGELFAADTPIEITGEVQRFVSRAGEKLAGALAEFAVDPAGKICLDAGSSTGGFTDCLLQHGALRVYALDVTISQMAWKLQSDPRVIRIEGNVRYLPANSLAEAPALLTVDLSFISVTKVLPALTAVAAPGADFLILVKPQFELQRGEVGRGGIVREPELHARAIAGAKEAAEAAGLQILGVLPSRVLGAEGNQEFFLHARGPRR